MSSAANQFNTPKEADIPRLRRRKLPRDKVRHLCRVLLTTREVNQVENVQALYILVDI